MHGHLILFPRVGELVFKQLLLIDINGNYIVSLVPTKLVSTDRLLPVQVTKHVFGSHVKQLRSMAFRNGV